MTRVRRYGLDRPDTPLAADPPLLTLRDAQAMTTCLRATLLDTYWARSE